MGRGRKGKRKRGNVVRKARRKGRNGQRKIALKSQSGAHFDKQGKEGHTEQCNNAAAASLLFSFHFLFSLFSIKASFHLCFVPLGSLCFAFLMGGGGGPCLKGRKLFSRRSELDAIVILASHSWYTSVIQTHKPAPGSLQ